MTTSTPADSPLSPENAEATTRAVQAAMTQQGAPSEQVAFAGNLLRDDGFREQIAVMEVHRQRERASFLEWLAALIKAIFGLIAGTVETVVGAFASKDSHLIPPGFMEKNKLGLERMVGEPDAARAPRRREGFDKRDWSKSEKEDKGQDRSAPTEGSKAPPKKRKGFASAPIPVDDDHAADLCRGDDEIGEDGLTDVQRMFVHNGDMSHSEALAENEEMAPPPDLEAEPPRKQRKDYSDRLTGILVDHGPANYNFDREEKPSYYVTIERANGQPYTQWGKELADAMIISEPTKGDRIKMTNLGKEPVEVDGRVKEGDKWVTKKISTMRNKWQVDILEKAEPESQGGLRVVRVK